MSTMTKYFGNVGHHLAALIHDPRYALRESVSGNGNVALCYDGQCGDASIRIEIFRASIGMPPWAAVTVGFGEVRNTWRNQTPMAERGIVYATSNYREPGVIPFGGSALPGYELIGLKWRVSGIAPKSRTSVPAIRDGYMQTDNILEHLLSLRDAVAVAEGSAGDLSQGEWDRVAHRTGFGSPQKCPCCGQPGGDGTPCMDCSDEDGDRPETLMLRGFYLIETGGSCTALRQDLPDGRYILVTGEEANAPTTDTTDFVVGLYRESDDETIELREVRLTDLHALLAEWTGKKWSEAAQCWLYRTTVGDVTRWVSIPDDGEGA